MLPVRLSWGAVAALVVSLLAMPATTLADDLRSGGPAPIVVSFDPIPALTDTLGADTLCVSVTIDAAATDVRGYSLVFEYDNTSVAFAGANAGSLMVNAGCGNFFTVLDAAADSIWIDAATLGCSFAGPGEMAELCFTWVECEIQGQPLTCRVDADTLGANEIRDGLNQSVPYSVVDGLIIVDCPIAVESRSWGKTKAHYRRR
jgi:hypothetical protein